MADKMSGEVGGLDVPRYPPLRAVPPNPPKKRSSYEGPCATGLSGNGKEIGRYHASSGGSHFPLVTNVLSFLLRVDFGEPLPPGNPASVRSAFLLRHASHHHEHRPADEEGVYATPALVEGRIYLRTGGHLYCFDGKP